MGIIQPSLPPPLLRTMSNLPKMLSKTVPKHSANYQSLTYQVVFSILSLYDFQCCYSINKYWVVKRSTVWNTHCVKIARIRSFFDPYFTGSLTEYGEMWTISPYSVRIRENKDQKNSEYGGKKIPKSHKHFTLMSNYNFLSLTLIWGGVGGNFTSPVGFLGKSYNPGAFSIILLKIFVRNLVFFTRPNF